MKLAIITCAPYPPILGSGARLVWLFEPLSKEHEIHIFNLGYYVSENNDFKDNNFYVHKIKLTFARLKPIGLIGWAISGITKKSLLKRIEKFGEFDAIYNYCITPWASLSLSPGKKFSIPLFSDYQDLELLGNSNTVYSNVYDTIMTNIFKKVFRDSKHIFPISIPLRDRLVDFYKIPREKITIIPNGADTKFFNPGIDGSEIKEKFGLSDYFVIGYAGSLIGSVRLDVLFEAFKKLKMDYSYIKLLIVGGHDFEIEKLRLICEKLGIENDVIFTGLVPYEEIPKYIKSFDIAVATYSKVLRIETSSPLKIIEYMSVGKAVVADNLGSKTIKDMENGILFEPEDAKSLENAIRMILDDEKLKSKLEINARKTALNHDWKILLKRVEEIMIENLK